MSLTVSKILVTDDEPDLELIITQKFRSRISKGELIFEFAQNGEVALAKLQADPTYDLVFTDINMPVMDGLTLLKKMKEHDFAAKAIVISAYGDVRNIRAAMNRGAFDFIVKPIDLEDLEVTLIKAVTEIGILKQGIEARNKLGEALMEKARAQAEALQVAKEKEILILEQNEMLEKQVVERTQEINQQKEVIELKNREIVDSIHYAKRLQEAILPGRNELQNHFPQSFIFYRPKDIVAGDFYWFTSDKSPVIVVADCTGHGVSGALMSMLGMSLLNQIVNVHQITQPAAILDQLHKDVVVALKQSENNSREGMDIAICKFDADRNSLEYSGANRPLWILRKNELLIYNSDKMPVGDFQIDTRTPFTNHTILLEPNDKIFMFTDGFGDQFGGANGKKLMTKKIKTFLLENHNLPMQELGIKLNHYFNEWKANQDQVDDVLFLGLKTEG